MLPGTWPRHRKRDWILRALGLGALVLLAGAAPSCRRSQESQAPGGVAPGVFSLRDSGATSAEPASRARTVFEEGRDGGTGDADLAPAPGWRVLAALRSDLNRDGRRDALALVENAGGQRRLVFYENYEGAARATARAQFVNLDADALPPGPSKAGDAFELADYPSTQVITLDLQSGEIHELLVFSRRLAPELLADVHYGCSGGSPVTPTVRLRSTESPALVYSLRAEFSGCGSKEAAASLGPVLQGDLKPRVAVVSPSGRAPRWLEDGRLSFDDRDGPRGYDPRTGALLGNLGGTAARVLRPQVNMLFGALWLRDGTRPLRLIEALTGSPTYRLAAIAPGGEYLAVEDSARGLLVFSLHGTALPQAAALPDGGRDASPAQAELPDVATDLRVVIAPTPAADAQAPSAAQDAQFIAPGAPMRAIVPGETPDLGPAPPRVFGIPVRVYQVASDAGEPDR